MGQLLLCLKNVIYKCNHFFFHLSNLNFATPQVKANILTTKMDINDNEPQNLKPNSSGSNPCPGKSGHDVSRNGCNATRITLVMVTK